MASPETIINMYRTRFGGPELLQVTLNCVHQLMYLVVIGEAANFAAYTFAPAILVTPLGALSVLIGYPRPVAFVDAVALFWLRFS